MTNIQGMKVLLVDDDDSIRQLLELNLLMSAPTLEVRGAGHGDRALELCEQWKPDAVVVDGHMPGLSGDDLGEALRVSVPDATIVSFTGVQSEAPWASLQVVKASDDAVDKVVEAIVSPR